MSEKNASDKASSWPRADKPTELSIRTRCSDEIGSRKHNVFTGTGYATTPWQARALHLTKPIDAYTLHHFTMSLGAQPRHSIQSKI